MLQIITPLQYKKFFEMLPVLLQLFQEKNSEARVRLTPADREV